jgi:hypothetical protein
LPSGAFALSNKNNLVLYLDKELVEKSKELGFNLSKTFDNYLKQLITQFSTGNSVNSSKLSENKMNVVGLPGFEPGSIEPKSTSLDQASRQPLAVIAEKDNFDSIIKTLAKLPQNLQDLDFNSEALPTFLPI